MKKHTPFAVGAFLSLLAFAVPVIAVGDYGLSATANKAELTQYGTDLPSLIGTVIGAGLSLIGVVFFVLVVYGGLMWMTARGESDKVKKAMDTIIAAAIGLVLVLASYAITNFVMNSVKSEGGGGGGGSENSCEGKIFGADCGDNSVCDGNGQCVSECEAKKTNGVCGPARSCSTPKITEAGFCPGTTEEDIVCCFTP